MRVMEIVDLRILDAAERIKMFETAVCDGRAGDGDREPRQPHDRVKVEQVRSRDDGKNVSKNPLNGMRVLRCPANGDDEAVMLLVDPLVGEGDLVEGAVSPVEEAVGRRITHEQLKQENPDGGRKMVVAQKIWILSVDDIEAAVEDEDGRDDVVKRREQHRLEHEPGGRHLFSVETEGSELRHRNHVDEELEHEIESVEGNGVREEESDCELNFLHFEWLERIFGPLGSDAQRIVDESGSGEEETKNGRDDS